MPGTVRILCVDDHETSRHVLVRLLSRFLAPHYEETLIRAVAGGDEAIAFLRAQNRRNGLMDLVVTDMHMPQMDGAELLRRLRQNTRTERVPVVLLSANEFAVDDARFASARPDLTLCKPLDRTKLQGILDLLPKPGA